MRYPTICGTVSLNTHAAVGEVVAAAVAVAAAAAAAAAAAGVGEGQQHHFYSPMGKKYRNLALQQ